jgi:D-3-phosphoglycerate dehydrogenase
VVRTEFITPAVSKAESEVGLGVLNQRQFMNIKIIEPIGQSEAAIRSRLRDLLQTGGHRLFICDTRGLTDADLIQKVNDADVLLLSNRPLSRKVIEA